MGSSRQYTSRERLTFLHYLRHRQLQEIDWISLGVPATWLTELAKSLYLRRRTLLAFLGISRVGVNRQVHACLPFSANEAARVFGLESLIRQVRSVVEEGAPGEAAGFDAARWLGQWLRQPLPALGDAFRPVTSTRLTDRGSSGKCCP